MAFNPLHSFQKNKRFWMAAILMICMVTFVFCTGMKGDMQDRIPYWFGGRGSSVFTVNGSRVTDRDLRDLKTQRELANQYMKNCADIAFKNLTKQMFDIGKKNPDNEEDKVRRQKALELLALMQATLGERKSRPDYFGIPSAKFDDLVEFKLWQAEADRLGVYLDEHHVKFLFNIELYNEPLQWGAALRNLLEPPLVSALEFHYALREAGRGAGIVNEAMIVRAITEEFRVMIARMAVMEAQPLSFFLRRDEGAGFSLKFDDPEMPNETRAPLTLAQVWDQFKQKRAEFKVDLIPVPVNNWVNAMPAPNALQKEEFFKENNNKPNDPSSEYHGLEIPAQARFEYLYADAESDPYLGKARTVLHLKAASPWAFDVMQSPLLTAARYLAITHKEREDLQQLYIRVMSENTRFRSGYFGAASLFDPDPGALVLARLANRHPEAIASLVGNLALHTNWLDAADATAAHMAWGVVKHSPAEVQTALQSEARRRVPVYATLLASTWSGSPLNVLATANGMNHFALTNDTQREFVPPVFTLEAVQEELKDQLARKLAEDWAQENMAIAREEISKASGNEEKFKRVLKKIVPELKLSHGPADDKRGIYYNRFTIGAAKEFDVLKDSYLKPYRDMINMFEGRDLTPGRLLTEADFYKLFFEPTESSFSAVVPYRAMSWPPEVRPSNQRVTMANPRLINPQNIDAAQNRRFLEHLQQSDPNKQAPNLDLFKTAAKPILFWRTADLPPMRIPEYAQIGKDLNKFASDRKKIAKEIADNPNARAKLVELRRQEAELKQKESDLKEMLDRVVTGWKLKEARETKALPAAKEVALKLVARGNDPTVILEEAAKLKTDPVVLSRLSQMYPENFSGRGVDYGLPPMPKDKIPYPRDDTIKHALSLYDMQAPVQIGYAKLDEINKELFDTVKKDNHPKARFVQILTNKPRTFFYVAVITSEPHADKDAFHAAMKGAPYGMMLHRDHFAERVQEAEAKQYRQHMVAALRARYNYRLDNEDLAKQFEERGGN